LKTAHLTVQEFAVAAIHIVLDPAKTRYLALRFQGRRLPDFEQSLSPPPLQYARTLRSCGRFNGMSSTAEAAKNTVEIGKKHILDQRLRIVRQRELIARLERDGSPDLVANAVRLLAEMVQACGRMEAEYAAAQERLSKATVDELSLAKVEQDTPM
jgi:hypothetical protein